MLPPGRYWASGKHRDTTLGVGKHSLRREKAEAGIPWLLGLQSLLENCTEKSGTKCQGSMGPTVSSPGWGWELWLSSLARVVAVVWGCR